MQDSLLELDPLHLTLLPLWQHLKLPKAWEGDGDSSIPNYCGAAAMRWAATTQQWLYVGTGWEAEGPGPKRRQQWHKDLLQAFPEAPAWPVGTLLLTALALVSSRKHLE